MKKSRIYADTSVFGGCFDDEFSKESKALFEDIKSGKFILVISTTTLREIDNAPDCVQNILSELSPEMVEIIVYSEEIGNLRDAYLKAKVVGHASKFDAEHIAVASVAEVDFVVSWNFKHIVHYEKISGYQAVNLLNGYKPIHIYSPKEVVKQ
ncbi:MAG: PIN domain protein [Nitrospirota bacterium]